MSAVGPYYYTKDEESEMEAKRNPRTGEIIPPTILYCLFCSRTAWKGVGAWEISIERRQMMDNGADFHFCSGGKCPCCREGR